MAQGCALGHAANRAGLCGITVCCNPGMAQGCALGRTTNRAGLCGITVCCNPGMAQGCALGRTTSRTSLCAVAVGCNPAMVLGRNGLSLYGRFSNTIRLNSHTTIITNVILIVTSNTAGSTFGRHFGLAVVTTNHRHHSFGRLNDIIIFVIVLIEVKVITSIAGNHFNLGAAGSNSNNFKHDPCQHAALRHVVCTRDISKLCGRLVLVLLRTLSAAASQVNLSQGVGNHLQFSFIKVDEEGQTCKTLIVFCRDGHSNLITGVSLSAGNFQIKSGFFRCMRNRAKGEQRNQHYSYHQQAKYFFHFYHLIVKFYCLSINHRH